MRAVVARTATGGVAVEDVELPGLEPDDVRVDIAAAGVCHSDLSMIDGTFAPEFPLVLGHEAAGVVSAAGPAVDRVRVGDHVVLNWAPPCRSCWFCTHGEPWLCAVGMKPSVPRGALADGSPAHATLGLGALAEQVTVPQRAVVPIPRELPMDDAALLGCAVLTAFGAVRKAAGIQPSESVAVVGLGGVGLAVVAAARAAGALPILAVDASPGKQTLALAAGATRFVPAGDTAARQVRSATGGRGVDHAFECVGRAETIRSAWSLTRRGGSCTILGIGRRDDRVAFSAAELFHFARTLRSSVYGSSDPDADLPGVARAVLDGVFDPNLLVTHRVSLDEVPEALDRLRRGEGARTIVTP
ncbi:MAG TPA: alcohol dehydrogenase catalytic domain-containing protein [Jiangellales bacterium]|nr:alcohol dehydrogenase catalytic domain-containing protein [Jiangellales bacterium]